jgi:hypothetical protein
MSAEHLVRLANAQLERIAAEFIAAMVKPTGPSRAVVFRSIEDHRVRLDFSTEPSTNMCVVVMVSRKEALANCSTASTFEESIKAYPWARAVDALALD